MLSNMVKWADYYGWLQRIFFKTVVQSPFHAVEIDPDPPTAVVTVE